MKSTILLDNWGLQLANWALSRVPTTNGPPLTRTDLSYMWMGVTDFEGIAVWEDWIGIMALADLLEALVLYDTVIFPEPIFNAWLHRAEGLKDLLPFLKKEEIGVELASNLREASAHLCREIVVPANLSSLVSEGSIFYLLLGSVLDTPYRPSPKRADFMSTFLAQGAGHWAGDTAQDHFLRFFETESIKLCEEIRAAIGLEFDTIRVPVVASYIFSQVKEKEEISSLLMEIRGSRERKALVDWLEQMNMLLETGNVVKYAKEFQAVRDLFGDLSNAMGLRKSESATVTLGLSPSLDVSSSIFSRLFRRRPPHTVLVRRFADHLLSSQAYAKDVHRLFRTKGDFAKSLESALRRRIVP